jgi:hypothetical protein
MKARRDTVIFSEDQDRRIEAWRARQPRIPSRAETIRRLVEIALKAEAGKY